MSLELEERIRCMLMLEELPDEATADIEMASVYLNCKKATVYNYVSMGVLKPIKWGVRRKEGDRDRRTPNFYMCDLKAFKTRERQPKAKPLPRSKTRMGQKIDYNNLERYL